MRVSWLKRTAEPKWPARGAVAHVSLGSSRLTENGDASRESSRSNVAALEGVGGTASRSQSIDFVVIWLHGGTWGDDAAVAYD